MNLQDLTKPFDPSDIEWRVGQCGNKNNKPWARVLAYVTNRAIMERLDSVCGPENWQNVYKEAPCGGVLCGISIYIEDRGVGDKWVTKWDGAENTDIESIKGGLSGAMKRAGSQWGIGRYLYKLEDGFAQIVAQGTSGAKYAKPKDGPAFYWLPPHLPYWALPQWQHIETKIKDIKDGIASGNYEIAGGAWASLSDKDKHDLWVAPSKGGVFTTQEREAMKQPEFREAGLAQLDTEAVEPVDDRLPTANQGKANNE